MRKINRIVIHCTATPQTATVQSILNYWENVKMWKAPGYHFLIEPNGVVHTLLHVSKISNGARGFNQDSIHVSYIGGVNSQNNPIDNRTPEQKAAMQRTIGSIHNQFPGIPVVGHRDLPGVTKACPSFDVKQWLS